jgi:hypothetical protein
MNKEFLKSQGLRNHVMPDFGIHDKRKNVALNWIRLAANPHRPLLHPADPALVPALEFY